MTGSSVTEEDCGNTAAPETLQKDNTYIDKELMYTDAFTNLIVSDLYCIILC